MPAEPPHTAPEALTEPAEDDELGCRLARWLSGELGTPVRIEGLARTTAGWSRENWVFEALVGDHRLALIARRDPVESLLATDRQTEAAILRHLEGTSVPAPRLRWADPSGERLGRPSLVMDRVLGVCDYFALNGPEPLERRVRLAHEIYDRLADIHLVDTAGLPLESPGERAASVALAHWEGELDRVQFEPEPELRLVAEWLRASPPANDVVTLVHGDFKAGNLLLRNGRVAAVLDWETAHLGDPLEDLGWVTNPFRRREHRIAGAWEPDDLLERWTQRTGMGLDAERLRWWQVLANFKLATIILSGLAAFMGGRAHYLPSPPARIHRILLDQIGA